MTRRLRPTIAVLAGVATAVVMTTVVVAAVDSRWPDDLSRTVGHSRWLMWATLLGAAHLVGGLVGGGVTAALDRLRPMRGVLWAGAVAFLILSVPVLGAFDRPVELASMVFLNLITLIGVGGGGALVAARLQGASSSSGDRVS
jgi:hypothetical protein